MSIQTTSGVGNSTANLLQPGFPIVGGDATGTNLTIRSNNSSMKGTVLLDEPSQSFGYNSGALQTLGGIGAQHNVTTGGQFLNSPYGYSVNNIVVPTGITGSGDTVVASQGGIYTGNLNLVGISAVATSGGIATFTFAAQAVPPFIVGQFVTVTNMVPVGYNGAYQVTACTTTTVSMINPTTGSLTGLGWISQSYGGGITQPAITIGAPALPNGSQAVATAQMNNTTLSITAVAGTGSVATMTFATQTLPPYAVGQWITVANVTPTGYNGLWVVTACTTTTVSYANATTGAVSFVAGQGTITSGTVFNTTVVNPGTGYNTPPAVVFQDPVPTQFLQTWASSTGANSTVIGAIPQTIVTTAATGTGALTTVSGTITATAAGTSVTCTTTAGTVVGEEVIITNSTGAGGLTNGTWYIASIVNGTTFTLNPNQQQAQMGVGFTFTSATSLTVNYSAVPTTAMAAGVATLTFTALGSTVSPFYPGQMITVAGVAPATYNNTSVVVWSATNTTVSYFSSSTGSQSAAGTIYSTPANCPQVFIKVPQSGGSTDEYFNYYQVTYPGVLSGTAPSHVNGCAVNGTAGLTYVGTLAQGYAATGYSGIVTQGAIHQVGAVTQLVVTTAGSGYSTIPTLTISKPDLPGGRQAVATVASVTANGASNTIIPANIIINEPGSGYLTPPFVTINPTGAVTSPAFISAVISSPGEKAIVSQFPTAATNTYFLDFGLAGNNVCLLTTGAASTIYLDNLVNGGAAPYTHGFPIGRRIILFVKNTGGSSINITIQNLQGANSSNGTNVFAVTNGRTGRIEFNVLTTSNLQNAGTSGAGGTVNDVYATYIAG